MRVVFIAGLVHSGSTLLDLLLGGCPQAVGLGELNSLLQPASPTLRRRTEIPCSCGASLARCAFWGPLGDRLEQERSATTVERYAALAEHFSSINGPDRILVDSSKALHGLEPWTQVPGVELAALHLVRDVRSWTVSMIELARRTGDYALADLWRKYGLGGLRKRVGRSTPQLFHRWYRDNRAVERRLEQLGLPCFRLGYEELSMQPRLVLSATCEFLGFDASPSMLDIERSASHVALGNRMVGQPAKRREVLHDHRWLVRREWAWPATLFPPIMRYNTDRVYSNLDEGLWQR